MPRPNGRRLVLPDSDPHGHDESGLPGRNPKGLRRTSLGFALRRGPDWICAPRHQDDSQVIPHPLTLEPNQNRAWIAPTIDLALERQALVRYCWGWATTIQRIR